MANETFNVTQTTVLEPGNDTDLDSVIDPGEVVTTTVTITNNSTTPTPLTATGVEFMEILAGMTILDQPGALDNINVSPIAFHDGYNVIGNTTFTVSAADGVLGGATAIHITLSADAEFFGHTIGANSATQTHIVTTGVIDTVGGTVTLNADGSFTYMPDAGFTGTDSFTYTLTDAGLDGSFGTLGDNLTGTATVTFNVQGTVWFIDNTAPGSLNLGTQANPFTTIAAFNLVNDGTPGAADPDVNDFIYLREGTYSEADGINLLNGQVLVGQGETLSVTHSVQGSMTVETGAAGQTPVIQVTGAGNQGIQLAQNNIISGLDVGMNNASSIGIADGGGSVGTLNILNVGVGVGSSTGQAIDIDQGGNLNVTLEVLNSTGSAGQGVQLAGTASSGAGLISGSFTAATGAISGSTGTGFLIGSGTANSGGTIAVSQGGSVTTAIGAAVEVYDRISGAGTITFSGDVDHTAGSTSGILLSNIAAGAINFSGAGTRTLNTTGGGHGVVVSGMSGTASLTFSNGALDIDTADGHGFSVGSMTGTSSINVQVAADIDTTGASGTVGRGLNLSNVGGSVNFTGGGLTITTVGGIGISYDNASQGSSLTISGAGNTVTTATGPILVMTNGALGAGGATFASLTSTGVTAGNAISINNLDSNSFSGGTVSIAGSTANGISIGNISSTTFNFGSTTIGTGANTVAQNGILLDTGNGVVTISSVDIDNVTGIGVSIQNATSTVTISGGTIGATNDPGGVAVDIGGGAAAVTIDASINKTTAGDVVEVTGRTGSIVDFNGNVTSTAGGGIDINTNTGGTVRFDGGMTLSTGAVTAFNATGNTGMTLVVTDPGGPNSGNNNVLTTTTATALNVANTTIGGEDLNFRSISSTGATNGIVLNTTGSTGGLNITGDGVGGAHSGGTIQNAGGDGIVLTNVSDVNFTNIRVLSVVGHGINANNLGGVNTITNSTIQFWDTANTVTKNGLNLVNNNTNMTSMVITGTTFDGVAGTPAAGGPNDGLYMEAQGSSSMNLRVEDSLFTRIFGDGIQVSSITGSTGTVQARIWDNDFTNAVPQSAPNTGGGAGGVSLTPFGGVTFRADVDLNTFTNIMNGVANLGAIGGTSGLTANTNITVTDNIINGLLGSRGISFTADDNSTFKLLLDNNTLDNLGSNHAGIHVNVLDSAVGDITITNNDVGQNGTVAGRLWTSGATLNNGILMLTQDSAVVRALISNNLVTANTSSVFEVVRTRAINNSTLNAIVTNNTITDSDGTHVEYDATTANTATINLDISGNLLAGGGAVGVIKLNEGGATSVLNVEQASQAAVSTANNNATVTPGGTPQYNTGNPPTPTLPTLPTAPLMAQPPEDEAPAGGSGGTKGDGTGGAFIPPAPDKTPTPVTGDPIEPATDPEPEPDPAPAPGGAPGVIVEDGVLSQAELNFFVDAAIARWTATGLDPEQVATLESLTFTVADMEALYLGSYRPGLITLDNDGAGYGWFLDYTPLDDSEFVRGSDTRFTAAGGGVPAGDFDLLTTLMHEMGHALGLHDMYDAASRDNLMYGYLFTGERRLPGEGLADGAVAGSITSEEFAGSPIIVNSGNSTTGAFILPAGYTVTIQWQATIDAQMNQLIVNPSNQGNVSATNPPTAFPDKLTDDPAVGGANDPTVTVLDTLTLGGTVWLDTGAGGGIANNGTKEAGETTVDGVLVTLFADTGSVAGSWDPTDTQIGPSILTAGGGNYAFTGLAPGDYIVRIDQDNFNANNNVSLLDKLSTTGGSTDPDDNIDNDDNGVDLAGGPVYSQALTLAYNSEPDGTPGGPGDTDGDADDDTNFTLDFGFVTPNQPPQQTNLQGDTATWTEGDGAVLLDDSSAPELAATITDPDSANFGGGSLIVTISVGAFPSEEGLFIQSIGNITSNPLTASSGTVSFMSTEFATYAGGGFAGGNITFTFDVNATQAAVQALVRAMSYNNNGGDNPTAGARIVSWTLNDGDGNVNGGNPLLLISTSINVVATNDNPAIANLGGDSVTYIEEGPAVLLDDSSAPEVAATVTDPDSAPFNGGNVTVSITANEAAGEDVLGISTAGTVTLSSGTSVGSVVSVGGFAVGTISANGAGGNDLVIALDTSNATQARVSTLVQALTYSNTNTVSPSTAARTVAISVADGAGGSDSENVTVNVTDTPENQPPVLDLNGVDAGFNNSATYIEQATSGNILAPALAITDVDDTHLEGATLQITGGFVSGSDYLTVGGGTFGTLLGITFNYSSLSGIMTLTGHATLADYENVLRQVGFESPVNDPGASRTITWTVNDGDNNSTSRTTSLAITEINDEPTLTATGGTPTYAEDGAAVDLFSAVDASTVEAGQSFTSLTLTVTNVTDGAAEILRIDGVDVTLTDGTSVLNTPTNGVDISVSVTGNTATVTVTKTALAEAALETIIDGITYRNSSQNPTDDNRVVTITQLVDNGSPTPPNDNTATFSIAATVNVNPSNDAATVSGTVTGDVTEAGGIDNGTPGTPTASANLLASDVDNTADAWQAVTTATAGDNGFGTYTLTADGVWTYTLDDTDPAVQALNGAATLTDTFDVLTQDGTTQQVTITIHAQDDSASARDDIVITDEATATAGSLFLDSGAGADADVDSPGSPTVTAVNGSTVNVDVQFTLPSGALLRVNANGTFTYNPNGAFNVTPTPGSGAANQPALDSFNYTLAGGDTALVNVTITGLDTNDLLLGTAGADTLAGGGGNDTYVVDNLDSIIEAAGQGFDQVYALFSYTLAAAVSAEVLAPTTSGSTTAINLFGNELGQQIFGNAGANILAGGGGTDSLFGLGGDDTYSVELDDFVFEGAGQGFDQVYVSADYVLAAGVEAEVLAVGDASSLGSIYLTGNAFGQSIFGNDGANVIDGGGGADALYGRGGDDLYSVQSDDLVFEDAGDGFDQVYTSGSFTLAAGAEVEVLATGNSAALTALSLTGNEFDQQIFGNAGANILVGGGGTDSLFGNGGADNYAFTAALGGDNVDTIFDYSGIGTDGDDVILLDDAVFTGLAPGALDPNAFVVGTAAADAGDRIIYDPDSGGLYFDADGSGAGAAILFAILDGSPAITAGDFVVI